jgi:hypothetical protein
VCFDQNAEMLRHRQQFYWCHSSFAQDLAGFMLDLIFVRGTADSDEDIEVVSEQLVGSSNRPAATGTSRRPAATRSRVSSGTGTLSVHGFTAREVQETEVSNQAATTSGNSDPPTQVAANLSLQAPSADSEDLSNEEKSILIAFNEAKRYYLPFAAKYV